VVVVTDSHELFKPYDGSGSVQQATTMVISIPIHIVVSYDFTILLWPIDTYHDDILIW
jgi:hypothetical protein